MHDNLVRSSGSGPMSLWACFDESGHPDDPQVMAFAIGGCITTEEHWAMFERKWKLALADEQLSWFHMVDFEHPEREGDNQFCRWNSSRRHGLLNRLLDIMNDHVTCIGTAERWPASGRSSIDHY